MKKNIKLVLGLITGLLLGGITAYAATKITAKEVPYTNSKLSGVTNVSGAIDELYVKASNLTCPIGYDCKPKYYVSYNACSGSGAPAQTTHTYGVASNISSTKPTRSNYTFQGWSRSSCSGSVDLSSGASVTNLSSTPGAIVPLYAVWESISNPNIVYSDRDCHKNMSAGSCPEGAIIHYKVNNNTTKYFYVMNDNGTTITMMDQSTTIKTAWNSSSTAENGPLTALANLENATSGWTNVNNMSYTMGTTLFGSGEYRNSYTACDYPYEAKPSCISHSYTLGKRTAKARMITVQELSSFGCSTKWYSCPKWLNFYENSRNSYYWAMNSISQEQNVAFCVEGTNIGAFIQGDNIYDNSVSARAVVEINK